MKRATAWMSASAARAVLSLALLSGFLQFFRVGGRGLFEPDEGRYAEIPREMIALADWITPHLNYVPYFEKPPLVYWMTAGLYRLLGESGFAARVPSAFFTVVAVIATGAFGRRIVGDRAAWIGGAVLSTALLPLVIGRIATLDAVLAALVTVSIFAFHQALRAGVGAARSRDGWLLLGYVSAALASLAKGPVGAALPALVIGAHLLLTGRIREIRGLRLFPGALIYLAITAPWLLAVSRRHPGFLEYFFLHQTLLRYVSKVHERTGSVLYYVPVVAAGMAPWSLLLPRALAGAWRDRGAEEGRGAFFLLVWAAAVFLFFSLAGSKLPGYLLPALPPLALLLGRTLAPRSGQDAPEGLVRTGWLAATLGILALLGAAGLLVPSSLIAAASPAIGGDARVAAGLMLAFAGSGLLALRRRRAGIAAALLAGWVVVTLPGVVRMGARLGDRYSAEPIARRNAGRLAPGDLLLQYRGFSEGLPFYLRRRVILYRRVGELFDGYNRSDPMERARWFLTEQADLARLLSGNRRVFVLVSRKDEADLNRAFPALVPLDASARYVFYANRSVPITAPP